ncbi:hypothetical protein FKG94_00405 [Exilibacterium tricleocarpae]|uniref:Uncharacterized protein n=1 Tax=Exilibacterium tricleocarpae TaxID=2591008 RepID=A0A545U9A3_9GAMM|nr:hypothetical protein [Exilibacterium tricleocarpae]TQV86056.1 hypothetical protein FKG94_00405 [Exilibacterium tricleocarpae]
MKFHDDSHHFATLAYHSAQELDVAATCSQTILDAVAAWQQRADAHSAGVEFFTLDRCRSFSIDYQGHSSGHWPNERDNLLGESLVREFLFDDGICSVEETAVKLYKVNYSVMAGEYGNEYLLVCPFLTATGNIGGIVVTCVNMLLR